jgi:hypothetical protein
MISLLSDLIPFNIHIAPDGWFFVLLMGFPMCFGLSCFSMKGETKKENKER